MIHRIQFRKNRVLLLYLAIALFLYFLSNSLLKKSLLAGMHGEKLNLDTLMLNLPSGVREKVKRKIIKAQLREDYDEATSDAEIIYATIALAKFEHPPEVLEKVYVKLLKKYPKAPQMSEAYIYFFKEKSKLISLTDSDLHEYIASLPSVDAYYMWQRCLQKMRRRKTSYLETMNFLKPLLEIKPEFKNYGRVYHILAEAAFQCNNSMIEERAGKLAESCRKMPRVEDVIEGKR